MSKQLSLSKAHFFDWVVKQPIEKSTKNLFEDYINELEQNPVYEIDKREDFSPLSFNDVDSIEDDLVFSALANNKFETCGELRNYMYVQDVLPNTNHPNAKRIVWESFAKRFEGKPFVDDDEKTINVSFDGCDDEGCIQSIELLKQGEGKQLIDTPLISPIEHSTWCTEENLDFIEAFQALFVDPLIETIPYDWYNSDGGYGTIDFRFNPDPDIMFDVRYEGYQRYTETTLEWSKDFDDE